MVPPFSFTTASLPVIIASYKNINIYPLFIILHTLFFRPCLHIVGRQLAAILIIGER